MRDEARESAREESVGDGIGDRKQKGRFKGRSATPTRMNLMRPGNFSNSGNNKDHGLPGVFGPI